MKTIYHFIKLILTAVFTAQCAIAIAADSKYDSINSLIGSGATDSAQIIMSGIAEPQQAEDKVEYFRCRANVEKSKGNTEKAEYYSLKAENCALKLQASSLEAEYKLKIDELKETERSQKRHIIILWHTVAFVYVLIIVLVLWGNRLKLKSKDKIIRSMQADCDRMIDLCNHTEQFKNLSNTTINTFLTTIKDICATKNTSRKIDRNHFERIRESLFVSVAGNANFWQCLKAIINSKHNNLITRIETDQLLTESDIRLLCLVGCGFSNISIILLTTYTNLHSVSNRKRIIADKLKLSATLEELFTTEG